MADIAAPLKTEATIEVEDTGTAPVEETPETPEAPKPEKAPRVKKVVEPHACLCQIFRLTDPQDDATVFDTECESTTQSVFAQGHDARLVSFLVKGQLDGYKPVRIDGEGGSWVAYDSAGHAASSVSELLGGKADKALKNSSDRDAAKAQAKIDSAARREAKKAEVAAAKEKAKAEKAAAPKPVAAKVVPGSESGDAVATATRPEPGEGEQAVTIKIGRNEIPATMNAEGTEVRWVNAKGEPQVRPADTVRILTEA